ncbi:MAG: hypothetical protein Q7S76_00085, partial [bacterium]|nr:hypothetical protein [bacterium]
KHLTRPTAVKAGLIAVKLAIEASRRAVEEEENWYADEDKNARQEDEHNYPLAPAGPLVHESIIANNPFL